MTVGIGTEAFPLGYWVCPRWSKILGFWLWLSELFMVIIFFVQVQLLATFTQISAFLNSLACCPFQVSRSQPCTLLSPTLFLPASSFPVYSLSHPTGAPGSLIPESTGTSSSHLHAFVPLSGMSFPSSGQLSSKLFIIEHPTLGQLWRFFHLWSEVAFESNPSRTFLEVWWLRDFTFQCRGRGFELWLGS